MAEVDSCSHSPNVSHSWRVLFIFLNAISGVIALGGNSIILLSIYKVRSLRSKPSNIFIASLASSDALVGLLVYPTYIFLTTKNLWFGPNVVYRMENFLWIQSLATSTYTLCAISVDRLIAVTLAIRYGDMVTKGRCWYVVLSIWISSFLLACSAIFNHSTHTASILWLTCLGLTFVLPFAIITYCYALIFRAANEQKRKVIYLNPAEATEMLKNKKAAWTSGIVMGIFFITFFPNVVFSSIDVATKDRCEKNQVYRHWLWGIFLAFSSSAWNPFVYAARIREFRHAFKKIVIFN
ncbi:beta-4C adrenergic receptor-like [Stylophora pistillata]|uniref:beta-4C adrenergic receptor-like n=1 Tax=Stylophora pistillata TaxID=50429 RepID=UPI000C0501F6|nr:beta-4C adrenergic receptor-like [Stylophora pistillata]